MKGPTEFIEFVMKVSSLINYYIAKENYAQASYCLGQLSIESEKMLEQVKVIKEEFKEVLKDKIEKEEVIHEKEKEFFSELNKVLEKAIKQSNKE